MAKPIEDLPNEIWKPVVNAEGLYEVSSRGRVRSIPRVVYTRASEKRPSFARRRRGVMLRPSASKSGGHLRVILWVRGEPISAQVHVLVLEAFVGPCPGGMECCHNNGNPKDNRIENLRWDTHKANMADRVKHAAA